jgi:hypothetical protein
MCPAACSFLNVACLLDGMSVSPCVSSQRCALRRRLAQDVSRRRLKQAVAARCPSTAAASDTPASPPSKWVGRDDWPHLKGPEVCGPARALALCLAAHLGCVYMKEKK